MPQRLVKHQNETDEIITQDGASVIVTTPSTPSTPSTQTQTLHIEKVKLEDLFNHGRWKRPFTFRHIAFCLYLPIGAAIWPIRLISVIILFTTALLVPKSASNYLKSLIKFAMGFRVTYRGLENLPKKEDKNRARILACNHLSDFDPYPLFFLLDGYHVMVASHIRKVPIVGKLYEKMNTIYVDQGNKGKAREDVLNSLSKSDLPLLIYPEGGLNSGKTGLMMFQKFVFGLGHKVIPIAMKVKNPWPVEIDYIGSSWFKNFYFWLLVPYNVFDLEFLPPVSINPGETDADFAKRVQTIIAHHLGLEATNYTYAQKKELAKQILAKKNK